MISITPYNITYLLSQALGVFAVYKFMKAFFDSRKVKKAAELISFVGYYILTSSVYLVINVPLMNFIVNLIALFMLTFLYSSSLKKRALVGLLTYIFVTCTEMIVVTLTGYINFPIIETNNYSSIFGAVAANILFFAVSMAASSFRSIKNGNVLPKAYWGALLTVPILSLYMLVKFFQFKGLSAYEVSFSVATILIINFMVFFLFDRVSLLYKEQRESALIKQQNEYYVNQLLLTEDMHKASGKLRHDIKNHLLTINSYLDESNIDEAQKHISSIIGSYQSKAEIVHTGFPAIDGLLNSKLQPASEAGITINVKASLPSDFCLSSFDLTVILGNLIDNALQAVSIVEKEKFIDFRMDCSKGMLIMKMSNPFAADIKKENGKIVTSKSNKEKHGFGLKNVDEVLEKYNGTSKIDEHNNIFTITIALYLE